MSSMKLGSLFSGSGGFELAGAMFGIEPVWSSEIEKYPLAVEAARFPHCTQLGSVTNINGADVEPVDIITFGSPCQDLSRAGGQAGIHNGSRSCLFFEAVRIIREMRNATSDKFPRFAVWENVPGVLSSNRGEDFHAVLTSLVRTADPLLSVPETGEGRCLPAGCIVGEGFSIAWRVLDAQFFGLAQRRKRVYLVADFGSERAGEILFESEGSAWDYAPCEEAWQRASAFVAGRPGGGSPNGSDRARERERERVMVFDARGNGNGKVSPTLTGDHQNRITDYTAIAVFSPLETDS